MRKLVHSLAPLGLVLAVVSQIPPVASHFPGRPQAYLVGGLGLMLLHALLFWESIVAMIGRRQLRYGGNMALFIVAVLGILGVANYIVYKNTARWDLTKNRRFTLSDQTQKVVKGLKADLNITHFFVTDERTARLTQEIQDRLTEYAALSKHVKVRHVDVRKEPAEARRLDVKAVPTLVFDYGNKREQTSTTSEQDVTNTIIKVTREGKKAVCFVKGEGERESSDTSDRGYSGAKAALEKSQYETRDVSLTRESKVPEACRVVVVPAPEKDLVPDAVAALREYVSSGGRAVVMLEPEFKGPLPNLDALIKEWSADPGRDVVLELYTRLTAAGFVNVAAEQVVVEQYPFHEITKDFPFSTRFDGARSITGAPSPPPGVTVQNLIQSSEASWATTNLALQGPIEFKEGRDKKGPATIGVAITRRDPSPAPTPSPGGESPAPPESRVVVFGDADFASNALLQYQGNESFLLNTFAWLAGETDLISIRPRDPEDHKLSIVAGSGSHAVVSLGSLIVLPGLFVVWGVVNWWRRRA